MKGIYIHIPFCRQACRYCDFFFSVSLRYKSELMDRLVEEIEEKSREGQKKPITTIYLGGGTPSVLSGEDLDRLMNTLHKYYKINNDAEITIECNPDDMNRSYLDQIVQAGFNRVSIGIQSFHEKELQFMRRSHNVRQAIASIYDTSDAGIENITIDLIYGIPGQTPEGWKSNLDQALTMPVSHLSAYHLTYEEGTIFDHWRRKKHIVPVPEELSILMYKLLREKTTSAGLEHYEISNFSRPGKMSIHNMTYWNGAPYVGFGPSAHSYDGINRSWNVSSMKKYLDKNRQIKEISDMEVLNPDERYHDYLLTSLRTKWGLDPEYMLDQFGEKTVKRFNKEAATFLGEGSMWTREGRIAIKPEYWLIADHIIRALFLD